MQIKITTFEKIKKRNLLKNSFIFSLIFIFAILFLSFVITLNKNGFSDYKLLWNINKNLLVTIPIAGFGFGISSYLIQQMSNNKLADTSVLGLGNINLIALTVLVFNIDFGNDQSIKNYKLIYPFMFICISTIGSILIYLLSYKKNQNISKKFIITGIVLNFSFIAIAYAWNNFLPSNKSTTIKDFSIGFLDTASSYSMYISLVVFIIAIIWLIFILEKFKILTTNYQLAKELGVNPNKIYFQILIISGLLVGCSYSLVGNIVFLGLFVSNISMNLFKKNMYFGVPTTGLLSIIILSFLFLINKNIASTNLNTTLLIPIIGIPYFIYLVIKE